ncbi:MAG: Hsp20/alpha crystallin family protein [Chloroflexota bacterium]|nr:Hsp20/alpha crystallin family protein [Chloroflexota bacterium]
MSSLIRREPGEGAVAFPEVGRFPSLFTESPFWGWGDMTPAMDVYETDEEVVVKVAIPGIDPDDIDVTVEENTLTIKGEIEREEETDRDYVRRERAYGRFYRSLTLPGLSSNKAEGEYENGVLTLTFPKPEEQRRKTIKIQAK